MTRLSDAELDARLAALHDHDLRNIVGDVIDGETNALVWQRPQQLRKALAAEVLRLRQENALLHEQSARLQEEVGRLQEQIKTVRCAFCAGKFQAASWEDATLKMAEHIMECEQHPLRAATLRVLELEAAIKIHHAQKADDRCIEDDDLLYAAAGLPPCNRRVGDKVAMLHNCERFIQNRCGGGGWPNYVDLEAELQKEREAHLAALVELNQLHAAIITSGYGLLKASNGWSIHDVSERQKIEDRKTRDVIVENIELKHLVALAGLHECRPNPMSSACCARGTKTCEVKHPSPDANACDHGVTFDPEAAGGLSVAKIHQRWPRLSGLCPKGCGYCGIAYASEEHYLMGDW